MPQQHDIEIEILKDGTVRATVKGAKGKGCLKYMELVQQIVGKMTDQQFSAEYYEPDEEVHIRPTLETRQHG